MRLSFWGASIAAVVWTGDDPSNTNLRIVDFDGASSPAGELLTARDAILPN